MSLRVIDYLVILIVFFAGLFLYHQKVVVPLEKQCKACIKKVYVIDLDSLIADARNKALQAAMRGQKVDASEVVTDLRRRLSVVIDNLPDDALVLDKSAVLKGGKELGGEGNRPKKDF